MTPFAANLPRRYPGLKPFERSQSAVFYGRGEDVVRLTNLLVRERFVVLFAKSGIGKTSLLQAGVAPELEKQGFVPLFLRADGTETQLNTQIANLLANDALAGGRDTRDETPGEPVTLWEDLKRLEFDLDGLPATPVLVFDQFEEVFTLGHSEASRRRFLSELADLANETIPEAVRTRLMDRLKTDKSLTPELMQWWEKQPELRIVLSIRSDFLHLLDDISPMIPGVLRNRYQLQPLDRRQAQTAIEAPAQAQGSFASPRFRYEPTAIAEIIQFLAGRQESADPQGPGDDLPVLHRREEIESFNLQILCQHIEETIIEKKQPEGYEVKPAFYGGKTGLEREIRDFYSKQLQTLPEVFVRRTGKTVDDPKAFIHTAACLIEESLVTPIGRRCSMVDDFLTTSWKVTPEFLDTLVDTRLLRKELRLDDFYYEISHDTLLPAIIESRDRRRRQEQADQEKAELESRLAEEAGRREAVEAELRAINDRRRLARKVAIFSFLSLGLMILFTAWMAWNWAASLRGELEQADRNVQVEVYEAALPAYQELASHPLRCWLIHKMTGRSVSDDLADVKEFARLDSSIVRADLALGDLFFFENHYAAALSSYRRAADSLQVYQDRNHLVHIGPRDVDWRVQKNRVEAKAKTLDQRRRNAMAVLIQQFDLRQRDTENFMEAGIWGQALRNLEKMEELLPEHPEDLEALQKALSMKSQNPREYVDREKAKCLAQLR